VLARHYVTNPGRSSFDTYVTSSAPTNPGVIYAEGGSKTVWTDFRAQNVVPLPDWLRAWSAEIHAHRSGIRAPSVAGVLAQALRSVQGVVRFDSPADRRAGVRSLASRSSSTSYRRVTAVDCWCRPDRSARRCRSAVDQRRQAFVIASLHWPFGAAYLRTAPR